MIFQTIDDIKLVFGGANVNNQFDTLLPYLEAALEDVLPYLSQDMWDKLDEDYQGNSTDDDHLKLLKVVRQAMANFAYLRFASDGTMQINDAGFHRVETPDEKSAYSWMMTEFKNARIKTAWESMNRMLHILNKEDVAYYSTWKASAEYEFLKSFFLWNTEEFAKYRSISDLRTLHTMRNSMIHVQEELIRRNVTKDLYDELIEELSEDEFSADNQEIVPFIRKAVAHLSTARAIDEGLLSINERGLTVKAVLNRDGENEDPAGMDRIAKVKIDAEKKGNAALKELRIHLNTYASATKYPSYFANEDLYDDPADDDDDHTFENVEGGTFFGI